jgi:hypothetical protein
MLSGILVSAFPKPIKKEIIIISGKALKIPKNIVAEPIKISPYKINFKELYLFGIKETNNGKKFLTEMSKTRNHLQGI